MRLDWRKNPTIPGYWTANGWTTWQWYGLRRISVKRWVAVFHDEHRGEERIAGGTFTECKRQAQQHIDGIEAEVLRRYA